MGNKCENDEIFIIDDNLDMDERESICVLNRSIAYL